MAPVAPAAGGDTATYVAMTAMLAGIPQAPSSNNPITGRPERWFDPGSFARPVAGFLGDLGRNTLLGPAYVNLDLSLAKEIPLPELREGARLSLRFEFFNLFNTTNFNLPASERIFFSFKAPFHFRHSHHFF